MTTLEERLARARGQTDLASRLEAARGSARPVTTSLGGSPFGNEMVKGFANNALALPQATGNLLAGAATIPAAIAGKARGEPFDFANRFREQQDLQPAALLRAIPAPTVQGLAAAARSIPSLLPGGETPREAYANNRATIAEEDERVRQEHPFATGAGEVAGDVATLITGRAPIASLVRRAEERLTRKGPEIFFGGTVPAIEPGIRRTIDRALKAETTRRLARGAGRSVETGLEAAILETVKGDNPDPLQAAALAAGGQVAGSAFLEGGRGLLSGGLLKGGGKVALAAGSIAGMWQLVKSATPGGRDRILESIEHGFDSVAFSVMLGAVASVAGAPRYRDGKLAEELPRIVDGLASVPRGATLSLLTDFANADESEQQRFERVLNNLARDPDFRGRDAQERKIVARIRGQSASGVIDRSRQ
jgi:hypothetical protein